MSKYVQRVLAPAALAIRAGLAAQAAKNTQDVPSDEMDAVAVSAEDGEAGIVLSIDGEHDQLEALLGLFDDTLSAHPQASVFNVMKLAAACSKTQQPCDVCPSFMVMKRLVKLYGNGKVVAVRPRYMDTVMALLSALPKDVRLKYENFLLHFTTFLSTAFNRANILSGWENTGLSPMEPLKILGKCTTFEDYSEEEVYAMVKAIPSLSKIVIKNGEVTDAEIAAAMKGDVEFRLIGRDTLEEQSASARTKTPVHLLTINRRRAL